MAKYETALTGSFDELLALLNKGILKGSMSASLEDSTDVQSGGTRCAVRVYERYSMMGNNRVSMNITLLGNGSNLYVVAITAGGSQAVLFKVNTFGEESFLSHAENIVENYKRTQQRR